jgi:NodT family efflux transporter outer membrane factor (OMF) lipoprotein
MMMRRVVSTAATATWTAALTAACAVGPNYHRPTQPPDPGYGTAPSTGATQSTDAAGGSAQRFVEGMDIPSEWWALYKSDKLDRLIEQALKGNPNVGAAQAALKQAHELYLAQKTAFFPNVQGSFGADRSEFPVGTLTSPTTASNSTYSLYTAQLSLSYMPDIYGATRRAVEAAKAQEQSTRFQLEATYLTLTSNVVVTAVTEASLRGQIKSTERLLELQHHLTDIAQKQRGLGTASDLDILAQQSAEAQIAQTLPPLQKQLGQTRDALTALLGKLPAQEPAETFTLEELTLPEALPVSLPSKLIEQRPDVRQAEENLHAASAAVGIAIADMLPQFAIDADLGSSSLKLGQLFSPYTGFWDAGASLTQTLFDAGALLHKKRAADAALDQAGAQYRAAVVLACQNVADTLRALAADADALRAAVDAERASRKTWDLAREQRALGTLSPVAEAQAELAFAQAQLAVSQAQANRFADTAGLFQALGGGWWNRREETHYEQPGPSGK